ncbi:hypothetical protein PUNSTDRAFT_42849 [Punctularia strigosozonata HHB-11173 SS5]|uniref:uncharacterized protein n=1 Tax=Punctularia strigosozonata (strain HHB-11173) TaxID=741275 RepID=UPI000441775F|nr:uncharacterized protein PUNSTDRAFT_42849 [Punctularia strigosozonata HHB-11173 SS5]EIN11654.1 hypothetical protein PUNSTDRAFT_42849 [Punctularia strigosozonata HHB-11173 SS5]
MVRQCSLSRLVAAKLSSLRRTKAYRNFGDIWRPILPHLPLDVRFIAFNQRGYDGSSPSLEGSGMPKRQMTEEYATGFALFIDHIVHTLGLPSTSDGGGIILLAWSKGSVLTTALLSRMLDPTQPPLPSPIHTHLAAVLLFEPPSSLLARRTPDLDSALGPPGSTPAEAASSFLGWCASNPLSDEQAALARAAFEPRNITHGFEWGLAAETAARTLRDAAVPIGLLVGTATRGYFVDAAGAIARAWSGAPNARVRVGLEGADHVAMVAMPERFARAVVSVSETVAPGKLSQDGVKQCRKRKYNSPYAAF